MGDGKHEKEGRQMLRKRMAERSMERTREEKAKRRINNHHKASEIVSETHVGEPPVSIMLSTSKHYRPQGPNKTILVATF